ncbi:hypothetical protein [Leptolyngbya sp. AS-A5]|uniref:hypothetical protein n=2 Tax=unclassified Leptolyngbya TaxID=2650499 RepID=UPI003298E35C
MGLVRYGARVMSKTSGSPDRNSGSGEQAGTIDQFDDEIVSSHQLNRLTTSPKIQQAQETLYQFFLEVVRQWFPEEVLLEFKRLFLCNGDFAGSRVSHAIEQLIAQQNEIEFRNALKRCCYILVNNWDATRHYTAIQSLIQSFQEFEVQSQLANSNLKHLESWIQNFINSKDYEDLKLFATRNENRQKKWINRYISYLLVPQYVESNNPIEQREAARALSRQLKDRFKFDLAMYIAKSQSAVVPGKTPENPTALGDNVLMLVKAIVAKRGQFSYENLANIFINQIQTLNYREFKQSLQKYLIFSVDQHSSFAIMLQSKLAEKLDSLYIDYDFLPLTDALILRTCNRLIEVLTTENRQDPSPLFVALLAQGNSMTLVIVLLKLVLICSASRSHLEAQIAILIRYYDELPEQECSWIINFLEIFNVTFAIHAENVQYNLVNMQQTQAALPQTSINPDHYRIFSQMKPIIRHDLKSNESS